MVRRISMIARGQYTHRVTPKTIRDGNAPASTDIRWQDVYNALYNSQHSIASERICPYAVFAEIGGGYILCTKGKPANVPIFKWTNSEYHRLSNLNKELIKEYINEHGYV